MHGANEASDQIYGVLRGLEVIHSNPNISKDDKDHEDVKDFKFQKIPGSNPGKMAVASEISNHFPSGIKLVWRVQQSGAVEACWAHNPEVRGSKPRSAKANFWM